jgi:wyosine [tRNA(Phe)-imidazoG37] synthetase (radical SAM superfamily)
MQHVFGPVPSRRLGRSLGLDFVPFKTCPFDCVYCQLGPTTHKTADRAEWVSIEPVLAELRERLVTRPDYITLSGSGEPTLHARAGELIRRIQAMTDVPVAVLTNGALLDRPEVRAELGPANLVVPSLDGGDAQTLQRVNRPVRGIRFDRIVEGLAAFAREAAGEVWLEVMIVGGYNDADAQVARLAEHVRRIRPDRVQLNTVTRPPTESDARPVPPERLAEIAAAFDPPAEVIAQFEAHGPTGDFTAGLEDITALLARRPCTLDDVTNALGMHRNEAVKYLEHLTADRTIEKTRVQGRVYYRPASKGA